MRKKELHKEIFVVEDFLSKDDCESFLQKYENENFEEAKVSIDGEQVMFKGIRNNDRYMFFDESLAEELWNRIKEFVPSKIGFYKAIGLNEMFRVYKYSVGQRFKMHIDGSFKRNLEEESFLSFIIYLNDDFKGGETEFRNLFVVKPKKGKALIFRHRLRHEGKEIISGIKYVLRTDIMYRRN